MTAPTTKHASTSQAGSQLQELEQVRLALRPGVMGASLRLALGEVGQGRGRPPDCRISYVKYEPGEYCIVLYELDGGMVVGYSRWEEKATERVPAAGWIEPLGMQVYAFPVDPWLPELPEAVDPQAVAAALAETLPECRSGEARVLRVRIAPQRYRPGRRFTSRLDVTVRDRATGDITSRTFYGKVYHQAEKARAVYEEMRLLSESAAVQEGKVHLAEAAAFIPGLSMVLQQPVAGVPLEEMISPMAGGSGDPRAWDGTRLAASALAAVHTSGITTKRQRPIADELKRFKKRAAGIKQVDPVLGMSLLELAAALPNWLGHLEAWGAELSLIHGDCKPSQFLIQDEGVAILDFDHCGTADPANDVGTFLATFRQLALRQSMKLHGAPPAADWADWLLALENHFLDEYCHASGRPESFRLRATWYEAAGLLRKALRGFGRSPFSPLPGALVAEAWHCLAQLPAADSAAPSIDTASA